MAYWVKINLSMYIFVLAHISELAFTTRVTEKCDVYSFGVLVLELFTGIPGDSLSYLSSMAKQGAVLWDFLDAQLPVPEAQTAREIFEVIKVAVQCIEPNPSDRPTMKDAVKVFTSQEDPNNQDYLQNEIMTSPLNGREYF
jgi:serine/threonine protein kinase